MSHPPDKDVDFESVARHYARLIRTVVGRVAGRDSSAIADDVEQQVLVALWKISSKGEQIIHNLPSYVYRVAVRETVRLLRQEYRRKELPARDWEGEDTSIADADRIVEGKEVAGVVAEVLQGMSADRQRAVRAHLAGFSVKEVMTMFGWSYNRARNLIARGMADLRRGLRARGIDG